MILRYNIKRIGKVKFWVLVLLPLIYFLSYYFTVYREFYLSTVNEVISENFTVPILLYSISSTTCGILFGLSFLSIAWSISPTNHIRDYMLITGFGFMLFINTASATVLQTTYPPFGLSNISFVGLSAYLILFGLYRSALSVAHDVELRRLIRNSLVKNSDFLNSIGNAQMVYEFEKKVLDIAKKNSDKLKEESGAESSMTDEEISEYIQFVMKECGKMKRGSIE